MSDSDAWDADDYDPTPGSKAAAPAANTDKWEGEDEEDDVKDAWDADSDEEKPKDDKPAPAKPSKFLPVIFQFNEESLTYVLSLKTFSYYYLIQRLPKRSSDPRSPFERLPRLRLTRI